MTKKICSENDVAKSVMDLFRSKGHDVSSDLEDEKDGRQVHSCKIECLQGDSTNLKVYPGAITGEVNIGLDRVDPYTLAMLWQATNKDFNKHILHKKGDKKNMQLYNI